jgi:hypothetical protein
MNQNPDLTGMAFVLSALGLGAYNNVGSDFSSERLYRAIYIKRFSESKFKALRKQSKHKRKMAARSRAINAARRK